MNTEEGRPRQQLMDNSYKTEEKAGRDFTTASETKESKTVAKGRTPTIKDDVRVYESILTNPAHPPNNMKDSTSKDIQTLPKPSLSYIALIAKVILSSSSQKLNLGSIYRAMEEQFPYLRTRGPGWRNSVRHNLSVNDCFVKVSRCEDGRGHYWGVHHAHLRDFQCGNFRQYRNTRGRRGTALYDSVAWMKTSGSLGRFCESRSESLAWLEPQCPLQEPRRNQISSLDWTQLCYQPWSISVDWVHSSSWMRCYHIPERLTDSHGKAVVGRGHNSRPSTSPLHRQEIYDRAPKGMTESYDSRFPAPAVQPLRFPLCCCMSPVITELTNLLPYKVNF